MLSLSSSTVMMIIRLSSIPDRKSVVQDFLKSESQDQGFDELGLREVNSEDREGDEKINHYESHVKIDRSHHGWSTG